jgi:hypothetical protein
MKIYSHSKYDPPFAKGRDGVFAPHTPYTYLLNEIASDFEDLTEKAVRMSVKRNQGALEESSPSMTGTTLVRMWCLSIWELMSEPGRLEDAHLDRIVERYFRFMFALGWQTTEILYTVGQSVPTLNVWRDLMFKEFEDCAKSPKQEHSTVLHRVFGSLDWGKPFISEGYDWLETKLHPNFFPK